MNKNKIKSHFNEEWSRWEPNITNPEGNYYIINVEDNHDVFKIVLEHERTSQKIEIIFHDLVLASRHTDEGLRFILFAMLSEKYGNEFYAQWTFFKVTNSDFLQWLSTNSGGVADSYKLIHFVIKGADTLLDIAASYEPEVRAIIKGS